MNTIHIFCFMGKVNAGKSMYVKRILSDSKFANRFNLSSLVTGTTRKQRESEKDGDEYYFFTEEKYKTILDEELVESRSYYTLTDGVVYYFTKIEYLKTEKNILCITTPYQYETYKHWCEKENIKTPGKYKLHLIYIDTDIKIRIDRALSEIQTEEEICEFARKILRDKNEFDDVSKRIPELIDPMLSNNVCFIFNNSEEYNNIKDNLHKIKSFIERSLK